MEKALAINNTTITYTLRRSRRAKRLRLSVACGGVVTVTAPKIMRESSIEAFVTEKASWVLDRVAYYIQFPKRLAVPNRKKHFKEHKEKARTLVLSRLEHFNRIYGFSWGRVSIRNQRSRWGSCSRRKNLNFNYRIALLPASLADYIIVHELCHLQEMNHGPAFWRLVEKVVPEHRTFRRELRREGVRLV